MEKKLLELIRDNLTDEFVLKNVSDSLDLSSDLGMDSVDLIKLFSDIEDNFNFEFDYEQMTERNLLIYGELKRYIIEKIGF